jgi:hypothetical protein
MTSGPLAVEILPLKKRNYGSYFSLSPLYWPEPVQVKRREVGQCKI